MNDLNIMDFTKVCRGCLSDKLETFQPLYNFDTKDIFINCTSIMVTVKFTYKFFVFLYKKNIYLQISEFDELPCNICPNCIYMCTSWVSFKQLCEQTDATLKKQLNLIKTSKTSFQPLDSFEIIQIKSDQLTNVPEDICGLFVLSNKKNCIKN